MNIIELKQPLKKPWVVWSSPGSHSSRRFWHEQLHSSPDGVKDVDWNCWTHTWNPPFFSYRGVNKPKKDFRNDFFRNFCCKFPNILEVDMSEKKDPIPAITTTPLKCVQCKRSRFFRDIKNPPQAAPPTDATSHGVFASFLRWGLWRRNANRRLKLIILGKYVILLVVVFFLTHPWKICNN